MENSPKPLRRVLILADFACATGFAQVAQNVVRQLLLEPDAQYQIDIVAINYHGLPNEWQGIYPTVRLFPAVLTSQGDVFGRRGYLNLLASGVYDLTWILQDHFNIEVIGDEIINVRNNLKETGKKTFKWIFYFPIDGTPKENWIAKTALLSDIPVTYTQFGYDEAIKLIPDLKDKLKIIPHGIDEKIFKPLPEEERKQFRQNYFQGLANGRFLITNVNRNQPRKDVMRTMKVFADYKQIDGTALLYLHMKNRDVAYTIDEVARNFGLIPDKDYITPKDFDEHDGFPVEVVNAIYNASDVVMTTTLGEGWGLSITEAMATKTPVIAPKHTSLVEMIGEDRGYLIPAGKTSNDWVMLQMDNERLRPLVSVPDFVDGLMHIKNNYPEAKAKAEVAYNYLLQNWTWDIVGKQWRDVFKRAGTVENVIKIGRNDPCPECKKEGNEIKYKHCSKHGLSKTNG